MEKKNKLMIVLLIIIILLLFSVVYLLFFSDKTVTITFDTNGGNEIADIEVQNGEIVKLPEPPKKEGYKFVGWTNKNGNVVTKGTKVKKDLTLKAEWISETAKTNNIQFDTDGGNEIDSIVIENGKIILLPIEPIKEGYKFVGWIDENGYIINEGMVVTGNIVLKALWISEDAETIKLTFNTDGGSVIKGLILEKGKGIILPSNPTKTGYVFAGWVDGNGNSITKDSIINGNVTLKALWKSYTCPTGCTPIGDGSKCTREKTTSMVTKTSCPSGYTLKNGQCLNMSTKYHAKSIDKSPWWACNSSSEYMYTEIDKSGMGAMMWCVKKTNKVTTKGCPSGYTKVDNTCKKTETVNCTIN